MKKHECGYIRIVIFMLLATAQICVYAASDAAGSVSDEQVSGGIASPLVTPMVPAVAFDESTLAAIKLKAEQGEVNAQRILGIAYYKGDGVIKDYHQAVYWWRKAAEQDDAVAQWSIGLAYYEGKGVLKDYKQAVAWFRKAAEQGNAEAQGNLGLAYYLGLSVPESRVMAYMWSNIAVASGVQDAANVSKFRDELEKSMTSAQVTHAQELASRWKIGDPDPGRRLSYKHNRSDRRDSAKKTGSFSHPLSESKLPENFKPTPLDKAADSIMSGSKKAWKSIVDYVSKLKN